MVWGSFAGNQMGELIVYPKGSIGVREYINTFILGLLPFRDGIRSALYRLVSTLS
jgi:hypothetical protein